jgi:hypothetical protein
VGSVLFGFLRSRPREERLSDRSDGPFYKPLYFFFFFLALRRKLFRAAPLFILSQLSVSNINTFRCRVSKTVLRMDIGVCFRHRIWKPHYTCCDEVFRKLIRFKLKGLVIELIMS